MLTLVKKIINIKNGTGRKKIRGRNPKKKIPKKKSRTPGQKLVVLGKKGQPGQPTRKPGAFNNTGHTVLRCSQVFQIFSVPTEMG